MRTLLLLLSFLSFFLLHQVAIAAGSEAECAGLLLIHLQSFADQPNFWTDSPSPIGEEPVTMVYPPVALSPTHSPENVQIILDYLRGKMVIGAITDSDGLRRAFLDAAKTVPDSGARRQYIFTIREIAFRKNEYHQLRNHPTNASLEKLGKAWTALLLAQSVNQGANEAPSDLLFGDAAMEDINRMKLLRQVHSLKDSFSGLIVPATDEATSPWTLLFSRGDQNGLLKDFSYFLPISKTRRGVYVLQIAEAERITESRFWNHASNEWNLSPIAFSLEIKRLDLSEPWSGKFQISKEVIAKLKLKHGLPIENIQNMLSQYSVGKIEFVKESNLYRVYLENGPRDRPRLFLTYSRPENGVIQILDITRNYVSTDGN